MKYDINLNNIKVTNAVASLINSAFETGLNPAWYYVESLNKDGFLDAAFEDSNLETPSGNPAKTTWSFTGCLVDCDDPDEQVTEPITVTAAYAVNQWIHMAKNYRVTHLALRADAYLRYLMAIDENNEVKAEHILMIQYEPDGVHDDALTQYIFATDVIFG